MKKILSELEAIQRRPSLDDYTTKILLQVARERCEENDYTGPNTRFCRIIKKEIDEANTKNQLIDIFKCIGRFREFEKFQDKFRPNDIKKLNADEIKKDKKLLTEIEKIALEKLEKIEGKS